MNDPHVVALNYVLEHDDSVSYEHAEPISIEQQQFRMRLERHRARFEFKTHYATVQEAQNAISPFIEHWQFRVSVQSGPRTFSLKFENPEIIDRQPTPGVVSLSAQFTPTSLPAAMLSPTPSDATQTEARVGAAFSPMPIRSATLPQKMT